MAGPGQKGRRLSTERKFKSGKDFITLKPNACADSKESAKEIQAKLKAEGKKSRRTSGGKACKYRIWA